MQGKLVDRLQDELGAESTSSAIRGIHMDRAEQLRWRPLARPGYRVAEDSRLTPDHPEVPNKAQILGWS